MRNYQIGKLKFKDYWSWLNFQRGKAEHNKARRHNTIVRRMFIMRYIYNLNRPIMHHDLATLATMTSTKIRTIQNDIKSLELDNGFCLSCGHALKGSIQHSPGSHRTVYPKTLQQYVRLLLREHEYKQNKEK